MVLIPLSAAIPCYSSGADASSLSNIGHHLSGRELLTLPDILQGHVIDSLKQIGLDIKSIGGAPTTIEKLQSLLHSLEQHESCIQSEATP